jgi:hypothetical protein
LIQSPWKFAAQPWSEADRAKRAGALAQPMAKPAPPVDPRVAELRAKEAEITRLKAAVAKKEREDGMIRELRLREIENDRLAAELAKRERRANGKGIRFATGFRAFGKHEHSEGPKPAA